MEKNNKISKFKCKLGACQLDPKYADVWDISAPLDEFQIDFFCPICKKVIKSFRADCFEIVHGDVPQEVKEFLQMNKKFLKEVYIVYNRNKLNEKYWAQRSKHIKV